MTTVSLSRVTPSVSTVSSVMPEMDFTVPLFSSRYAAAISFFSAAASWLTPSSVSVTTS